jgi:heat shock protein HtpX
MFKNTVKTAVLLAAIGGLLVVVGQYFGGTSGAIIGLALGLLFAGGSYWFSAKLAIASSRAKPVSEKEAPDLYRMMRDLTMRAQLPMPRLYMIPAEQPNAFASGRNPKHAVVAVTEGITKLLNEEELRGVLAHELAHVRHRDILISSVVAAVAMGITFIARMAMWGAMFGGMGGDDDEGGGGFGLLIMAILAPIAAFVIQMAVSRSREFEADRGGAEIAGGGEPLARALEKLHEGSKRIPMKVNPAMEQAFIVNPLTGRQMSFAKYFMTHPPVEDRIARLRQPLAAGRMA